MYSEYVGPEIPNSTRAFRYFDPPREYSYNADGLANGPEPGVTTVQSIYQGAKTKWANKDYLGTLVGDHFEFITYQ